MNAALPMLGSIVVGPVQFDRPVWLVLVPALGLLTLLISRRSLAGLGPVTRWAAITLRLLVIVLVAGAMGEPQWRKESKDVAVTAVIDASESIPASKQSQIDGFFAAAAGRATRPGDRLGVVTAGKQAFVQELPTRLNKQVERLHLGELDATNLAAGLRLALAVAPKDAGVRLVLVSDGNQTTGNVLQAAEAAKAAGVIVDVLPVRYRYDSEVLVDRLVSPATAFEGETVNLRVVLQATKPARGRLTILMNDLPVDLDPATTALGAIVTLKQGLNVLQVPVKVVSTGPQKFAAVFEPEAGGAGDVLVQNNQGVSVTVVSGEGRVLVLTEDAEKVAPLLGVLEQSRFKIDVMSAGQIPSTLTELNRYDAIVMCNESAYGFSQKSQEDLRQYVHETGGGLIMIGGPESFGAGGWIGSPLEAALPIRLDPPQKRQMPRGALALVMHSVEAPDGTFLGKKVCEAAVNSLSRLDLVGIVEYGWGGGTDWVHKLGPVGDGTAVKRSIQNLMFGDMPDFSPSLELALDGLSKVEAGQRHVIMISDGDPGSPSTALLDKFVEKRITISTVGIYPHSGGDTSRMQAISKYTGGRHYHINTQAGLAAVPQIFIKEAQTVRRSLIWEGTPFTPQIAYAGDTLKGLSSVPPISGYVVAAEREGLSLTTLRGKEGDPIMAQWQYGLGRVVTYTSDAATRWNAPWVSWASFQQFWEQHLRWVLRPQGNANVRVITENKGDSTTITIEALDTAGERLNFASFKGRLASPDGTGIDVEFKQVGPGRYQATVPSDRPGSYVLGVRYVAPDPNQADGVLEGSAQAAILRPFADEYRTLEDNAGLLTQVAEMTGGRVLSWEGAEDLWSRDGLTMPVATRPFWLWAAIAGLTLFLMDVGVRRVRIDIPAMWGFVRRGFARGPQRGAQQIGGLKAAREAARAKIAERAGPGATAADLKEAARSAAKVAGAKFEAAPEQLKRAGTGAVLGGAEARVQPAKPPPPPKDAGADAGMGRLLKAKQKAREDMQE